MMADCEKSPGKDDTFTICKYEAVVPMETGENEEAGIASTKEEEWVTKRTTELTTTKQVETRVKRQVILEDGKVIDDSGPVVSTNTKQDTEKQHHETREHRTPNAEALPAANDSKALRESRPWDSTKEIPPGVSSVVQEIQENRVLSRKQTDELLETEDVKHLGDIDDEAYLSAVRSGAADLRPLLLQAEDDLRALQPADHAASRVLRHTTRSHKVADTEDSKQRNIALPDGRIITEKHTTDEHEEITKEDLPEEEAGSLDSGSHTCLSIHGEERIAGTRESSQAVVKGVPGEMRYSADTRHAERHGDPSARMRREHWESLSDRLRRARETAERKDALTKRPLDFDAEERSRKAETNKWLDHHFGSDSRSSQSSRDSLISGSEQHNAKQGTDEAFFNVTIRSKRDAPVLVACVPKQSTVVESNDRYFQGVSGWNERNKEPMRPARSKVKNLETSVSSPTAHCLLRSTVPVEPPGRPSPPQRRRQKRYIAVNDSEVRKTGQVLKEPPPDYSPPSRREVKAAIVQVPSRASSRSPPTRLEAPRGRSVHFPPTSKQSMGSAIGQSIRKLVGKIRSVSAERKMRRQSSGRTSPPVIGADDDITYQKCNVIDAHIEAEGTYTPTQRYYLGEDPYGGSIYGRENKYDAANKEQRPEPAHTTSTLGRYGKIQKRRAPSPAQQDKTVGSKAEAPNRTPITRSKSFSTELHSNPIYRSNPQLTVTHDALKSPSLVVSLVNKSKVASPSDDDKRGTFMRNLHQRAPELYRTLHAGESITTG